MRLGKRPAMALRLWRTVRPLRTVQITNRLRRRAVRYRPGPALRPRLRCPDKRWQATMRAPSMLSGDTFRLLGCTRTLARAADWNNAKWPKLWLYNLHYFDDLRSDEAAGRDAWHRALIARWIEENPPATGNGWEPYPASLRCVNWLIHHLAGQRLNKSAEHSLVEQIRHLERTLEYHLLGNHLWANAKALVFAGVAFEGEEADRWLNKGAALLGRELAEQILADGGHFERSAMYHAIVLDDVLDLLQLDTLVPDRLASATRRALHERAPAMLGWLDVMTHDDGEITLFNDAAFGIAPTPAALLEQAIRLELEAQPPASETRDGIKVTHLKASGFVQVCSEDWTLWFDVGSVSPDYLPGHAHAGTLSFEADLGGERLIVDSGISTYAPGAERLRQRGTAAHNTLQLGHYDSSEIWGAFRCARRARVTGLDIQRLTGALEVRARHDGYARLPGRPVHERCWRFDGRTLTLTDSIDADADRLQAHDGCTRLHLAPPISASTIDGTIELRTDSGLSVHVSCDTAVPTVQAATWQPHFGVQQPNVAVVLAADVRRGPIATRLAMRDRPAGDRER